MWNVSAKSFAELEQLKKLIRKKALNDILINNLFARERKKIKKKKIRRSGPRNKKR